MKYITIMFATASLLSSCSQSSKCEDADRKKAKREQVTSKTTEMKTNEITAKNTDEEISCKLTSPELQKRKETVIASLKKQIKEKKELPNGFAYRFEGTDQVVDELAEFVKSERSCCSFFIFGLSFSGDGSEAWLNLTGPGGAKEMIRDEMGL